MSWSLFNHEILATHQPHALEMIGERKVINGNQFRNNMEMIDMNQQDVVGSSSSSASNKRRKKQSKVWEEMTKFTGADGKLLAKCIHCGKVFDGSSKLGTTHLNNHLVRCLRKRNNVDGDADKSMDQTTKLTSSVVIQENSVTDLIKNPTEKWDPSVLNSRKVEILQVYEAEKGNLRRFFSELSCRFSLVIEFYLGYYLLSVYYIDNSWEPKMKIIGIYAVNEDEERNLIKILKESCLNLKIDGNICSVIYHYFGKSDDFIESDQEDVIGEINSWFNQRGNNSLTFSGFLFSDRVLSYIFYNFCDNFKKWLWNTFSQISKCIDYVNSKPSNMHNFQIAVDDAKSMGKKVNICDPPPGHSMYNVPRKGDFRIAVGYKNAFCELERIDFDFKSRSINLTAKQWDEATVIHEHFEELLDSFDSLVKSEYITPNQYFPKFCDVYMKLLLLQRSLSCQFDKKTSTAIEKFASELKKYNLVLVIATVLDPRFKMDIVQLWYNKIYGRDADHFFEKIIDDFTNVYKEYAKSFESELRGTTSSYVDAMGRPCTSTSKSSELERYLNDPKVPSVEKFDILAWWRAYTPIFPTLAQMARDFLVLPISVYSRFSLFHLNYYPYRCIFYSKYLDHDIKQALLCLTAWLKSHEK
ncbi:Zinc finger BED domain-containing protein [Melia azedarach]|uniref:Zinc finger BED domain-containing protein n=1 Tax=Melia azedarach TaxID=155640 RepID=A0ACC1YK04_MELAZ|nr:Zinc finger BED domain-containing protein [Melia azedarach]